VPAPGEPPASRPRYEYDEYPKTLAADDFWGQVRRTRYGQPISEEEVSVIIDTIIDGLDLDSDDVLLDLACGNGALSSRLFSSCRALVGVDASEYLIQVARENFQKLPNYHFEVDDVARYAWGKDEDHSPFTKVLCYASFAYLSLETSASMLAGLRARFANVSSIFIGNVPDRERAHLFYKERSDLAGELDEPTSQIGIWWSQSDFSKFVAAQGWRAQFQRMPEHVWNSIYRYDAVLTKI
jgi:SAM-dependent methyltransferase